MPVAQTSPFSVVITSYGVGTRIERAVDSILNQTLKSLEVVVVDDGSNDAETLKSLDRLSNAIKIERMTGRRGAGAARNRGLALTSQPYVLCLDGDDWVEPRYLEMAQLMFEARPDVGVVSAWVRFEGDRQGEWRPREHEIEDLLAANQIPSTSAFRRCASEEVGSYADDLAGYHDWEHWIAIAANGWRTLIIPEILIHYELRPGSLGKVSNANARRLIESIHAKHEDLYRKFCGTVLASKHEQVIELEAEAREAWMRCEIAENELRRVWRIVDELGTKLESQGRGIRELVSELDRLRRCVCDLESASTPETVD